MSRQSRTWASKRQRTGGGHRYAGPCQRAAVFWVRALWCDWQARPHLDCSDPHCCRSLHCSSSQRCCCSLHCCASQHCCTIQHLDSAHRAFAEGRGPSWPRPLAASVARLWDLGVSRVVRAGSGGCEGSFPDGGTPGVCQQTGRDLKSRCGPVKAPLRGGRVMPQLACTVNHFLLRQDGGEGSGTGTQHGFVGLLFAGRTGMSPIAAGATSTC